MSTNPQDLLKKHTDPNEGTFWVGPENALGITLIVVVGLAVAAAIHWSRSDDDPRGELLRIMGAAAVSTLACGVAFAITLDDRGDSLLQAVANGAKVLTCGLIWAAVRRVNGSTLAPVITSAALAATTFALTFLLPGPGAGFLPGNGSGLREVIGTVLCALALRESIRGRARTEPGALVVGLAAGTYGVYTFLRLLAAAVTGRLTDAATTADLIALTLVSLVCVIAAVGGVFWLVRSLDRSADTVTAHGEFSRVRTAGVEIIREAGTAAVVTVRIDEFPLIRRAYGVDRTREMTAAVRTALRDALPGVPVYGSVDGAFAVTRTETDLVAVEAAVRRRFAATTPAIAPGLPPDLRIAMRLAADSRQLDNALTVAEPAGRTWWRPARRA